MSVIAWRDGIIAADKMMTETGLHNVCTKIFKINDNEVLSFAGEIAQGLILVEWYKNGKKEEDWPKFQLTDDWTRLIVASAAGVLIYDNHPVAIPIEDEFQAWGCGRDYAMGALSMGASAREAAEVACTHNVYCGNGLDIFNLRDL